MTAIAALFLKQHPGCLAAQTFANSTPVTCGHSMLAPWWRCHLGLAGPDAHSPAAGSPGGPAYQDWLLQCHKAVLTGK